MPIDRRSFLQLSAATLAAGALAATPLARSATARAVEAIAVDALTTFDPRPIAALAEQLFPGKGAELVTAWRLRQFEYAWLRTSMGRYADFWQVTDEALVFATKQLKLDPDRTRRERLMQGFLDIRAWPEALPAFRTLKEAGIRLVFLSNFTARMLDAGVANSGLGGLFEAHLTTDLVRAYKPDPRAYRMGVDALGVPRERILFAAFGGWDAAGAKSYGYPTFWVNRANQPVEELGYLPDAQGATLIDLAQYVLGAA